MKKSWLSVFTYYINCSPFLRSSAAVSRDADAEGDDAAARDADAVEDDAAAKDDNKQELRGWKCMPYIIGKVFLLIN